MHYCQCRLRSLKTPPTPAPPFSLRHFVTNSKSKLLPLVSGMTLQFLYFAFFRNLYILHNFSIMRSFAIDISYTISVFCESIRIISMKLSKYRTVFFVNCEIYFIKTRLGNAKSCFVGFTFVNLYHYCGVCRWNTKLNNTYQIDYCVEKTCSVKSNISQKNALCTF